MSGWDLDGVTTNSVINCDVCIAFDDVQRSAAASSGPCATPDPTFITLPFRLDSLTGNVGSDIDPSDLFIAVATANQGGQQSIVGGANVLDYGAFDGNNPPAGCASTDPNYFDCLMDAAFDIQQAALPVTLIGFEAEPREVGNRLTWTVADEEQLAGYGIEASTDGVDFAQVDFLPARANGREGTSTYAFDDVPDAAVTYYRLSLLDLDGRFEYSPIVVATREATALAIAPTVLDADREAIIRLGGETAGGLYILSDAAGRSVLRRSLPEGDTELRVDGLPAGLYVLHHAPTRRAVRLVVR